MKNKLLLFTLLVPLMVSAQFGAQWEKDPSGVNTKSGETKTFKESQDEFYSYWKGKDLNVKGNGYKVFKRWEEYWSTRLLEDGTVPAAYKYWEEYAKMKASFKTLSSSDRAWWTCLGPYSHTGTG